MTSFAVEWNPKGVLIGPRVIRISLPDFPPERASACRFNGNTVIEGRGARIKSIAAGDAAGVIDPAMVKRCNVQPDLSVVYRMSAMGVTRQPGSDRRSLADLSVLIRMTVILTIGVYNRPMS
jgi:hypothetical protein